MTISLTGADPVHFVLTQLPLTAFMIVAGLLFLFRGVHEDLHRQAPRAPSGTCLLEWKR